MWGCRGWGRRKLEGRNLLNPTACVIPVWKVCEDLRAAMRETLCGAPVFRFVALLRPPRRRAVSSSSDAHGQPEKAILEVLQPQLSTGVPLGPAHPPLAAAQLDLILSIPATPI